MKLLVVEDNPSIRQLLSKVLISHDFEVDSAECVAEATTKINSSNPFDALILDYGLPDGTGLDLIQHVREHCSYFPTIIMITADPDVTMTTAFQNDADCVIYKQNYCQDTLISAIRHYTERNRARERLEKALSQKQRLIDLGVICTTIFHDLTQPCTAIMGSIAMAQDALKEGDLSKLESHLNRLQTASDNANVILRDLRARIHRGMVEKHAVDPWDIVDRSLAALGPRLKDQRIQLNLTYNSDERPKIFATEAGLFEVMMNVVGNSIDALQSTADPAIWIDCAVDANEITLTVRDNGSGVAEDVREQVFEELFSTKGDEGTGMGLAISQRILQEVGGSIRLEAGPSACFVISIPRMDASKSQGSAA